MTSLNPENKLSEALNKVGHCIRLSSESFIGSILLGPITSRGDTPVTSFWEVQARRSQGLCRSATLAEMVNNEDPHLTKHGELTDIILWPLYVPTWAYVQAHTHTSTWALKSC